MTLINCSNCQKEFKITPGRLRKNKVHTCSKKCSGEYSSKNYSKKITIPCVVCNKDIFYKKSQAVKIKNHTCSHKCSATFKSSIYKNENPRQLNLTPVERFFHEKLQAIRLRSKNKGWISDLTREYLVELYATQKGLCAISNIKMELKSKEDRKVNAASYNVISIDRIDSTKGYMQGNIQLVVNAINMMKAHHSEEEVKNLLQHICDSEQKKIKCLFKKLHEDAKLPTRESIHNAGFDVFSIRYEHQDDTLIVYTGVAVQPEMGYYFFLAPRSSTFQKYGLLLGNSIGVIDQNYTGEIIAKFQKLPNFKMPNIGDRLIQLIPQKAVLMEIEQVDELPNTDRGQGGFGSSGN